MKKFAKIIALVLCLPFAFAFCSCGKTAAAAELGAAPVMKKNGRHDLSDEEYKNFLQKLSVFSAKFSEAFIDENGFDGDNLVISPVSIYMAFALAAECSDGDTRTEILNALGMTYDEVYAFTGKLFDALSRTLEDDGEVVSASKLTNSIWLDRRFTPSDETLDILANAYRCSTFSADFFNKNIATNKALRQYVKKNTNGLIDSDFSLSKETLFALVNTFYLKDVWKDFGELSYSDDEYIFTDTNGKTERTKLLEGGYSVGRVFRGDNYETFFATTSNGYKIKFILPKDGVPVEEVFTEEVLTEVNSLSDYNAIDGSLRYNTRCIFPKFTAGCDADLIPAMQALGVEKMFSQSCDFSRLTSENVMCDRVIHKAKLSADEEGIEGAAVTVVAVKCTSAMPDMDYENVYEDFVVDKSFAYIVTDGADVVLFSGIVNKYK